MAVGMRERQFAGCPVKRISDCESPSPGSEKMLVACCDKALSGFIH